MSEDRPQQTSAQPSNWGWISPGLGGTGSGGYITVKDVRSAARGG